MKEGSDATEAFDAAAEGILWKRCARIYPVSDVGWFSVSSHLVELRENNR